MEVKFHTNTCPCLQKVASQVQNQEQTQEVRLTESMPDIGNVLGAWGQVLIRGKEWRTGEMGISGGVLAWVLYAPEDGTGVRSVETWIPFQMKWDLPPTQRDGSICVLPLLKAVDARSTSARKLMVRASVSILGEALEPIEPEVCCPGQIPEDVQLLKKSYPSELPVEAGEKLFQMDEELTMPGNLPQVQQILRYSLTPEVLEQKVMAGRLVLRGKADLHLLYTDPDGAVQSWDYEIPFSQYTELDKDHSANAQGWVMVILTGMELDPMEDHKLSVKASMAAQYVIYDRVMLEMVEDAYSPVRPVEVQKRSWMGPVRLDDRRETMHIQHEAKAEASKILDVCYLPEHPMPRSSDSSVQMQMPGQFQVLYYDMDGNLQSLLTRAEAEYQIPSDPNNSVFGYLQSAKWQASLAADTINLSVNVDVETSVFTQEGMEMVCGMQIGEIAQPDGNRPSLILRRAGDASLWEIAKECGSTVDAILKVNQIDAEPESGRMLLIPVS